MDTTIITVVGAAIGGTIATAATVTTLVSRSIGNLRSHMDQRMDALTHGNQQAHDTIGLRIETQGTELGKRIDAQGEQLRARIDAQGERLGKRIDAQGERIDAQGKELRERIDAQGEKLSRRIDTQGEKLGERIDALEVRLARTSEDVSFIKGRLTADGTG